MSHNYTLARFVGFLVLPTNSKGSETISQNDVFALSFRKLGIQTPSTGENPLVLSCFKSEALAE